jgi:methyl coenzyme M reductase subunit D
LTLSSVELATLFLDFIFLVINHGPILPEAIQSGLEHGWRMGHTTARSLKTVSAARTPPLQGKGLRSRRGY